MKYYKCTIDYTINIEADNEDEARELFYGHLQDEVGNIEVEALEDDNEPAPEDGGCMYNHDHKAEPHVCEYHD
jgi:hypothetical protein